MLIAKGRPDKVLVVGAAGQVGAQLVHLLAGKAVFSSRDKGLFVDLEQIEERRHDLKESMKSADIGAIICVGGLTDVERCEAESKRAFKINAAGPAALAEVAAELSAAFVYFSTEYVFDGEAGPYREDAATNPLSVYGKSKWAGERWVQNAHPAPLVVRTTVVVGPDSRRKNFLYGLLSASQEGRPMRVASDQVSTPTYNFDLARTTLDMLSLGARGIVNVVGPEALSRFEFALRSAAFLGLDSRFIVPTKTVDLGQIAPRPLKAGLCTAKLRESYPSVVPPRNIEQALQHWREQLLQEDDHH